VALIIIPKSDSWFKKNKYIILLVLSIFSATGILSGCSGSTSSKSSVNSKANITRMYPVALMNAFPINPATLSVKFSVTNDGSESVSPQCKITMQDASGTYRGWDIFYLKPLAAGVTQQIVGTLTITKEGAQYANEFSGECSATTSDTGTNAGTEVVVSNIEDASWGDDQDELDENKKFPEDSGFWYGPSFKVN